MVDISFSLNIDSQFLIISYIGIPHTHGPRCFLQFTTKNAFSALSTGSQWREEYSRDHARTFPNATVLFTIKAENMTYT